MTAKKRMDTICGNKKESRDTALVKVKNCNMMDSLILESRAFKIIRN